MRRVCLWVAVLAALCLPAAARGGTAPALAVVLAIDVSASVDADSFILQRDGIANAFASRRLADAIAAVPGGVEALLLEWSDPEAVAVAVDWRRVADAQSAAAFAAIVHAGARLSRGRTAIGPALLAAARQFDRLQQRPARRVIDVSGDGIANLGLAPSVARDRIVKTGITINGLAILANEPWLAEYYRDNVIGGPGAFVLAAESRGSFIAAMLRKLVLEVAGTAGPSASFDRAQMQ
jgi:Protein of unknown function (DUF1194)